MGLRLLRSGDKAWLLCFEIRRFILSRITFDVVATLWFGFGRSFSDREKFVSLALFWGNVLNLRFLK